MNKLKRLLTILLVSMLTLSAAIALPSAVMEADAAAIVDINDPSVFQKQLTSYTCTLSSNVMMLRRAALLLGDTGWSDITESSMRPLVWNEALGMYNYYSYKNFTVSFEKTKNPKASASELIQVLQKHPEGIVAYDYDHPHAILLTDYTDGVFYCADPANSVPAGRIRASQALVSVSGIEAYWYVQSPDLSSKRPVSDDSLWQITAQDGVNIRSGAGLSYGIKGCLLNGTVVSVSSTRQADGYTWGYITYNGVTGWVALDYARHLNDAQLENQSSLSSTRIGLGKSVTIQAASTGGSGSYQYTYSYRKYSDQNWVTLKSGTTAKTFSYTPKESGRYVFRVTVTDSQSGKKADKEMILTVIDLINESRLNKNAITLHSKVKVMGAAVGGSGNYQYAYYCRKASSTGWYTIKNYSTSTSVTYTPVAATDYVFMVRVKDSKGRVQEKELRLTVNPPLVNHSKIASLNLTYGEPIRMTAAASGGTGSYQYAYFCKKSDTSSWFAIKRFSDDAVMEYIPKAATSYDVAIHVKDATGVVAKKYFTVNVFHTLRNQSSVERSTIGKGTSMQLYGKAAGGTGSYQYAYYCRKAGSDGWYTIKGYSSDTSASYTPVAATDYEVMIRVKDSAGKVAEKHLFVKVTRP